MNVYHLNLVIASRGTQKRRTGFEGGLAQPTDPMLVGISAMTGSSVWCSVLPGMGKISVSSRRSPAAAVRRRERSINGRLLYLSDLLYGEKAAQGIGRGLLIPWPPAAETMPTLVVER